MNNHSQKASRCTKMALMKSPCTRVNKAMTTVLVVIATVALITATAAQAADYVVPTDGNGPFDLQAGDSLTVNSGEIVSPGVTTVSGAATYININTTASMSNDSSAVIDVLAGGDLSDGITNNGTISDVDGVGVNVNTDGSISGGITNNGEISSIDNAGIIGRESFAITHGIEVNGGSISGGITNSNLIHGIYYGININNGGTVGGTGIVNDGIIWAYTSPDSGFTNAGINVGENSTLSGGITNNNRIGGYMGITASGPGALITGGITNSEDAIISGTAGIFAAEGGSITGGITNSTGATIYGQVVGVGAFGGSISGGIINDGSIRSYFYGIFAQEASISSIVNTSTGTIGYRFDGITMSDFGISIDASSVSGGITNSGTIAGSEYAIVINNASAPITITNTGLIDGAIALDAGTLNLNGDTGQVTGAVTGTTDSQVTVNGTFTTEAEFDVDNFSIASGGVLNMANNITAASGVANSGTLSVAAGNLVTIDGDYTQSAGGIFQTGLTDTSVYGQLVVTGTADLTASGLIDVKVTAEDNLAAGNTFENVLEATTLSAGELTITDDSVLWDFIGTVDASGNAIDLSIAQNMTVAEAVEISTVTPAALGAARAIDSLIDNGGGTEDMQTILDELGAMSTEQEIGEAVAQIMPALTGGVARATLQMVSASGSKIVRDRLARLSGLASGDEGFKDRMVWAKPFYTNTRQSERKQIEGYDTDSFGVAIGADTRVSPDWRIGAALSSATGSIDGDSNITRDTLDVDTYQLALYGTKDFSDTLKLNLLGSYATNNNDTTRHITFGEEINRIAKADFDSWHTQLNAELAKTYPLSENTTLGASFHVDYTYLSVDNYKETGADALNLHVKSVSEDALVTMLDGEASHKFNDTVTLSGHMGVGYDFLNEQSSITTTFAGGGPSFVTQGLDPSPWFYTLGASLDLFITNGMEITLSYDADGRSDYFNQIAVINLRMPF